MTRRIDRSMSRRLRRVPRLAGGSHRPVPSLVDRTAVTTRLLVNGHHPRSRTHLAAGSLDVEAALEHINSMNRPSTELTEQVRKLAIELAATSKR